MTTTSNTLGAIAHKAKAAAAKLRVSRTEQRNAFLTALAEGLLASRQDIENANQQDIEAAQKNGLAKPMVDRLSLKGKAIDGLVANAQQVRALPDPVGAVTLSRVLENGLRMERRRVPLGVILLIYEARPNATIEASVLAIKSGNAILLKGGSEAMHTNKALGAVMQKALQTAGLPADSVQVLAGLSRDETTELLGLSNDIDLCVPRGGYGLINHVKQNARMPVLAHGPGVCHIYVDETCDLEMAARVAFNSKVNRPSTCNSAETLLVHAGQAAALLPKLGKQMSEATVTLHACDRALAILKQAGINAQAATAETWRTEWLDLTLSVKVVDSFDSALAHIAEYGTRHTEAIITDSLVRAQRFAAEVDASAVLVNASTRLNDGFCLGYGAELGISTSKFHAYGPMGLEALTTEKNVAVGDGQTRR